MKSIYLFFLLIQVSFIWCPPTVHSLKIDDIDLLNMHIKDDTAFVFDLDEVLIRYTDNSDDLFAIKCPQGEQTKKIVLSAIACARWSIGWTSRPVSGAYSTHEQLKQLGIDFSEKAYEVAGCEHCDFRRNSQRVTMAYTHGIVFGGTGKGLALFEFLRRIKHQPRELVVIDDRLDFLKDVRAIFSSNFVPLKVDSSVSKKREESSVDQIHEGIQNVYLYQYERPETCWSSLRNFLGLS